MNRRIFHKAVPSQFQDPWGLAKRVLTRGGSHGRFSLLAALLTVVATPLDVALAPRERRLYAGAGEPNQPIVLVCGPPRSGTTLMAQTMSRSTDSSYFTNLTGIFPRSPISAEKIFRVRPHHSRVPLTSYYGRVSGFSSPNDGLHLWDRWLGPDRENPDPERLVTEGAAMKRFFAAFHAHDPRPLITKNNSLNTVASSIAPHLPTATFVCMTRDPVYLAQSLLVARSDIHGRQDVPYGISSQSTSEDPVADVIDQVRFHIEAAQDQQAVLGPEVFRTVSYEQLCTNPEATVRDLTFPLLASEPSLDRLPTAFQPSRTVKVDPETFARLEEGLGHYRHGGDSL